MRAKLLGASVAGALLTAATAHAEAPRVVASIAPIHSLVAQVMEGVAEPELLIPAEVSEHDYALKPSDVRRIAGADLVVWVGESLEMYLVKPLETEGVESLELIEAEGIDAHAYGEEARAREEHHAGADREEEHTDEHADADEHAHADENGHDHAHIGLDPHVWLDPHRAEAIVRALAARLSEIDPPNAGTYQVNAERAVASLEALDGEIGARLKPLGDKPFVTFHDGYSYFVERYGLKQVGEITVRPEQRPGAASLGALRDAIASEGVACVFAEPQFDPNLIRSLAGDAEVEVGILDALGAGLEPGPALYGELLRKNAEAVASCLTSTS